MRTLSTRLSLLLPVAFLALAACQAPRGNDAETSPSVPRPTTPKAAVAKPVAAVATTQDAPEEHTQHGSHGDPVEVAPDGTVPNRDRHGPRDTAAYIEKLQSDERIRELKPELVANNIFEYAGLSKDSIIADIGCGPGVFDWPLAALVPDGFLFAVDVEPAQLDALRAGLLERDIQNVVPVLASYSTPHIPTDSCDAILIADTYHHFEDRHAYMTLLRKRLTPGGYLILLEFKDGDLPVGPPASRKVLKEKRHAELAQAGFELERELSTHIFRDFEFWRVRRASR